MDMIEIYTISLFYYYAPQNFPFSELSLQSAAMLFEFLLILKKV